MYIPAALQPAMQVSVDEITFMSSPLSLAEQSEKREDDTVAAEPVTYMAPPSPAYLST